MIEPTETESRETLEAFAKVLLAIAAEDPQIAPRRPAAPRPISRPDEVKAAKIAGPQVDALNRRPVARGRWDQLVRRSRIAWR